MQVRGGGREGRGEGGEGGVEREVRVSFRNLVAK